MKSALDKARKGAVADPEFYTLARPAGEGRKLTSYHDPKAMEIKDAHADPRENIGKPVRFLLKNGEGEGTYTQHRCESHRQPLIPLA